VSDDARAPNLIFEQKIDLPYTYTAGRAQRAFLRALAEQKLVGSYASGAEGDGRSYVPARPFAPDGSRLDELEELPARGIVVASTSAHHLGGRVFGLVRVSGSPTPMLHHLEEPLEPGVEVEPVWEPGAEPGILALRCFRRAS
jgi:uncharacterized OB-fold protein